MLQSLQNQLQKVNIQKEETLLLAVSGGVDSMVLLNLFIQLGQKIAIAHVNFSLRNNESDEDEKLVKTIAQENKILCHSKKTDTIAYAKLHKLSIQMAAREIRYQWFASLQKEFKYTSLVTAHHLEDSIETFFINLNRGTGLSGLCGIQSNKERFRPLLNFSKEEIRSYAQEHKIKFREDASNSDIKYERNWFRHEILAKWKAHNPAFLKNMASTLGRIEESKTVLEEMLKGELELLENQFSQGKISFNTIEQLQSKKFVLFQFLSGKGFTEDQTENIIRGIQEKKVGNTFESNQHSILIDRENLLVQKVESNIQDIDQQLISENTLYIEQPIALQFDQVSSKDFEYNTSHKIEGFDWDKLEFPLNVRKWREGDKMQPLGMKGQKKISDILIDEKVSLFEKEKTWVLCSKDEIVWLIGIKIAEKYKIDQQSKKILQIEWKK